MKTTVKIIYASLSAVFLAYLILPAPQFPPPPPDSLRSNEPADSETDLRRAYFTNSLREEVITHYKANFSQNPLNGVSLRLNYPPEEASRIIRDQTRSTYLEEITVPLRESLYINGFEPREAKDAILIDGRPWQQKITVRYVPSSPVVRLLVGAGVILAVPVLFSFWALAFKDLRKVFAS